MDVYFTIVDDETIWACNLCNDGCDNNDEVKKHFINKHGNVIQILTLVRKKDHMKRAWTVIRNMMENRMMNNSSVIFAMGGQMGTKKLWNIM